ncbi:Uncharacterized protein FKW44_000524, partial [Caligus rogercresseyi]
MRATEEERVSLLRNGSDHGNSGSYEAIQRDPQDHSEGDDESLDLEGCAGSCCCHPTSLCHRLIALALMCFLGFGSYFCYDNPGALQ